MHVNLLPFAFQRKLLLRRLIRKWTTTWIVCALAVGLFVTFRYSKLHRQQNELQHAELGCADIRAVVASNLQLDSSLASMLAARDQLSQLEPDQDALAALAVVAQAVQATQGRAQIDTLLFHEPRTFTAPAAVATTPVSNVVPTVGGTITLNGIAADDEAIAVLIETMHRLPQMEKVELRASSAAASDGEDRRRFEIVCKY